MAKSKELFSLIDGKPGDAHLHEAILAGGDHEAATEIGRDVARRAGLTEEQIKLLYAPGAD